MKHQIQPAIQVQAELGDQAWVHNTLEDAWTSALEALERLGFPYATCVLCHDRLPAGRWVLRSDAAMASLVDRVASELEHWSRPGGFAVALGTQADRKAGWIIAPASDRIAIAADRKVEARRIAIRGYAGFMRILDEDAELDAGPTRLSRREKECLSLLAQGLRTQRIAERIAISPATVEFHFKNARKKLGALTREQALAISVQNGWVQV